MKVEVNGGLISYEKVGSGPPVVLVHGGEADQRMWQKFMPHLADKYTVVSYDQRDTADSQHPAESYTMEDLGDDLVGLVDALGYQRAHLISTSYGGMISQFAAVRHPERVDHVVLSGTSAWGSHYVPPLPSEEPESGDDVDHDEMLAMGFSTEALARDPGLLNERRSLAVKRSDESELRRYQRALGASVSIDLAKLQAPTLVFAGGADQLRSPDAGFALWREIPAATVVVLAGLGHLWELEDPERVANIITMFLSDQL